MIMASNRRAILALQLKEDLLCMHVELKINLYMKFKLIIKEPKQIKLKIVLFREVLFRKLSELFQILQDKVLTPYILLEHQSVITIHFKTNIQTRLNTVERMHLLLRLSIVVLLTRCQEVLKVYFRSQKYINCCDWDSIPGRRMVGADDSNNL